MEETSQGDNYTAGCLLDFSYFQEYYKLIAIDLKVVDTNPKPIQHINFNRNLGEEATMFSILEEVKGTILGFSQGAVRVL